MATLQQLLDLSRVRYPRNVAVEDPIRGDAMTYAELGIRADAISEALQRHGAGHGDRIGICAPKSCAVVAVIHGILATGAAYLPVDASSPYPRIAGILADGDTAMIVAHTAAVDSLRISMGWALQTLEELGDDLVLLRGSESSSRVSLAAARDPVDPASSAYILYTSGSTGKPKGVVHTHASALSFIDWCTSVFLPSPSDRFSSHAPFHFDLSILDLFVPAAHGASVVLIGEETGKSPQTLAALIATTRTSVWYSTPSTLRLLSDYGHLERHDVSALRLVLFAGEVFPVAPLRKLLTRWQHPRYFNLYGPTETNVCTFHEVPHEMPPGAGQLPIGKVCPNDAARVIDENDRDVERPREGELVVSGGTVMREYWNLPDKTHAAFLRDNNGVAWYRTGDIVREDENGDYHFLGRRDRMVKRRGYRVELGEIEYALATHPSLSEAAVTAVTDADSVVRIDAHVSSRDETQPSIIDLKRFCAERLPAYMVPDRFRRVERLPRTSTGKIDYVALASGS